MMKTEMGRNPATTDACQKKTRISDPVVNTHKKASAAASKGVNPRSTSVAPQSSLVRESQPEKRKSFKRACCSESSEDEDELVEPQTAQCGGGIQPTEARVNSTPNGNGNGIESVERRVDAPTPLSDPDVLDCPICFEPLNPPVYQIARMGIYHANHAASIRRTNAQFVPGELGTTVAGPSKRFLTRPESIVPTCSMAARSLYITYVVCIAPVSSERSYSYEVIATKDTSYVKLRSVAEMTPRWTGQCQCPENEYLLVPNAFMPSGGQLKLTVKIRTVG
ncbi:hypothetical protein OROHE_019776 [Orobanche hederae]